ncbi:pituitary tumor-transforming gene 1 protein-interacting protein-like [Phycodurus eques]|uniref:pituitary tumor-transforming gene 1 protein-interacting protein-like n=1 Tax=Phycodurus eques TaxID=693459 RepID=UPI002ACE4389|nr:pituitary tumor-transforming gene 1 protein-interacting protein-like [Phycodurus eques]
MSALYGICLFLLSGLVAPQAQMSTTSPPVVTVSCASKSNSSCAKCLQDASCLWCAPSKQCVDYPVKNILPPSSVCPLSDAWWGVCWVNFQIMMIMLGVLSGLFVLAFLVCCLYCCCCRRRRQQRVSDDDEDLRAEQHTRARNARQKERRMEMQLRHDKIRQKYGISKDNPYSRMDDKK